MKRISFKKRRGLHTIVGAVFFVLVMGSTIGYVTYSMNLVDNLAYQIDAKQDTNLNRQSEEFKIVDVSVVNNEFNLTVKNTGTIPINVTKMWVKNMTNPTWNQTSYQINQFVSPGEKISNIGQGTGLIAKDSESYSLKILTGRGNALETQIVSTINQPLEMSLFTAPPSPLSGHNVTLLYTVRNNLTEGIIQSIVPQITTSGTATAVQQGTVIPASAQGLYPGDEATFEYTYEVSGVKDEDVSFTASLVGGVAGNDVSDTVIINTAPVAEESVLSIVSSASGVLFMNYTTFQACEPAAGGPNCESDRSGGASWSSAWELVSGKLYLFRVNVTNHGNNDIFLEERTALIHFPTKDGSANINKYPAYIRADSTPTVENPGAYTNWSKNLVAGETTTIYFGSKNPPGGAQQDDIVPQYSNTAIVGLMLLIFGKEDDDCSLPPTFTCNGYQSSDPPYSQNIPFQAFTLTPP